MTRSDDTCTMPRIHKGVLDLNQIVRLTQIKAAPGR